MMLEAIHAHDGIALLAILLGVAFGFALAVTDWSSKFAIGGFAASVIGSITSLTAERFAIVEQFVERTALINPVVYGLNITLITFLTVLTASSGIVFASNYVQGTRRGDPESLFKATRQAISIFTGGLRRYMILPPDAEAKNTIRELKAHLDLIKMLQSTLAREVVNPDRSPQHFKDSIEATGRALLQVAFGETSELQQFRMAFFERRADRLEYLVTVNNNDWTAHSRNGFSVDESFAGEAIKRDCPLIYPKQKRKMKFEKRLGSRYQAFIAMPVPCGLGAAANVGVLTVDYTGKDAVFTDRRVEQLLELSRLIHSFYLLNLERKAHEPQTEEPKSGT